MEMKFGAREGDNNKKKNKEDHVAGKGANLWPPAAAPDVGWFGWWKREVKIILLENGT